MKILKQLFNHEYKEVEKFKKIADEVMLLDEEYSKLTDKQLKNKTSEFRKRLEEETLVKRKVIEVKPMDEEEAILQMELLGHEFFAYKNEETNEVNIIYKRKDGDYGILEIK